ncbi:hypothetical protein HanRHA438_Chr05g0209421 [Helianthus annuus]|nr:hypothetical protein HanRHA438_Chr05g0209421 [Helianthus annuus]
MKIKTKQIVTCLPILQENNLKPVINDVKTCLIVCTSVYNFNLRRRVVRLKSSNGKFE